MKRRSEQFGAETYETTHKRRVRQFLREKKVIQVNCLSKQQKDVKASFERCFVRCQALRGRTGWLHVVVVATDQGDEPLSDTANVYIHVQDVNDHKPEIYRPERGIPISLPEVRHGRRPVPVYTLGSHSCGKTNEANFGLPVRVSHPRFLCCADGKL